MGPYGSVGAHIKTGKRSMAPDHFQTPPDPKKGYKNEKKSQKISKNRGPLLRKYFPSTVDEQRSTNCWKKILAVDNAPAACIEAP